MYIHKINDCEVIFDSEDDYNIVTIQKGRKPGRRKIYIDKSVKNKPYAKLSFEGKCVRIHHILIGFPLNGKMVDHFNGNSLDNRRDNLRVVSRAENCYNKPSKNNHRWINVQKNGKFQVCFRIGLGAYSSLEEAQEVIKNFLMKNKIKIYKDFYE